MDLQTIRTLLFTPANKPERFEKAKQVGADGLIIDLEDSVTLANKEEARNIVINHFKEYKKNDNFIQCLRINSLKTPAGLKDLSALIEAKAYPDVIMVPKTEYAAEIIILDSILSPQNIPYLTLIESAIGLYNAKEIANASVNVRGLVFGGVDLAVNLQAKLAWEPLLNARSLIIRAAASKGIAALDFPYLSVKDSDDSGIIEETQKVKDLGYTGKLAIHPKHIQPIKDTFSPTSQEIIEAKKIVDVYESSGGNACEIDGKMIDLPVYKAAKRILCFK